MKRRNFIKTSLAASALQAIPGNLQSMASRPNSTGTRPNILFLFAEQHHPGVLSPAGHPIVQTPNLERLARDGVYFPNAYCPTPLCVPSRTSTITSRYSHATGIPTNLYDDLIGDQPNLARRLQKSGYHTCHIGKTHLATGVVNADRMDRLGFTEEFATSGKISPAASTANGRYARYLRERGIWEIFARDYQMRIKLRSKTLCDAHPSVLDPEDYHDEWISRTADEWLNAYNKEEPFYLAVNWAGPHAFRDAPGKYATMYDPADIDPPIDDPMEMVPNAIKRRQANTLSKLHDECWREIRASYYGMITLIDDGIGRILNTLENKGLLDNTVIIYSADHGEMLCDHGMVYKTLLYEGSAGVPMIFHFPRRFARNLRSPAPVSLIDLAPTLLQLAGAPPLEGAHGRSLVPLLQGESRDHEPVFSEFVNTRMVREGSWKYIEDPAWDVQQLFNLEEDPDELHNRVLDQPKIVAKMSRQVRDWLEQTAV